jgi:hypothetical protein
MTVKPYTVDPLDPDWDGEGFWEDAQEDLQEWMEDWDLGSYQEQLWEEEDWAEYQEALELACSDPGLRKPIPQQTFLEFCEEFRELNPVRLVTHFEGMLRYGPEGLCPITFVMRARGLPCSNSTAKDVATEQDLDPGAVSAIIFVADAGLADPPFWDDSVPHDGGYACVRACLDGTL